jgi:hypothetical protein
MNFVDLQKRSAFRLVLGRVFLAVAHRDRQAAKSHRLADRRFDFGDAGGDLVEPLQYRGRLGNHIRGRDRSNGKHEYRRGGRSQRAPGQEEEITQLQPPARLRTRASRAAIAASRSTNSRARSTTGTSIILPSTVTAPTPSASALS